MLRRTKVAGVLAAVLLLTPAFAATSVNFPLPRFFHREHSPQYVTNRSSWPSLS